MAAGSRKLRVVIERRVSTPNAGGGASVAWEEVSTEWARLEHIQSFRADVERVTAGGRVAQSMSRLHVPSNPLTRQVRPEMRVRSLVDGSIWGIQKAEDLDQRNKTITLTIISNE